MARRAEGCKRQSARCGTDFHSRVVSVSCSDWYARADLLLPSSAFLFPWAPPPTPNERKRVQRGRHHWHCSLPVHNVYIPLQNQIEANNRPNVPCCVPPPKSSVLGYALSSGLVTPQPPPRPPRARTTPHYTHPDCTRLQLSSCVPASISVTCREGFVLASWHSLLAGESTVWWLIDMRRGCHGGGVARRVGSIYKSLSHTSNVFVRRAATAPTSAHACTELQRRRGKLPWRQRRVLRRAASAAFLVILVRDEGP